MDVYTALTARPDLHLALLAGGGVLAAGLAFLARLARAVYATRRDHPR